MLPDRRGSRLKSASLWLGATALHLRGSRLTRPGLWLGATALLFYGTSFYTRDWRPAISQAQQSALETPLRPKAGQAGRAQPAAAPVRVDPQSTGSVPKVVGSDRVSAAPAPAAVVAAPAATEPTEPLRPAPVAQPAQVTPDPAPEIAQAAAVDTPPAAEPVRTMPVEPQSKPEVAQTTPVESQPTTEAPSDVHAKPVRMHAAKPRTRNRSMRAAHARGPSTHPQRRLSAPRRDPIEFRLAERGN
jgi:hypothetical protein